MFAVPLSATADIILQLIHLQDVMSMFTCCFDKPVHISCETDQDYLLTDHFSERVEDRIFNI